MVLTTRSERLKSFVYVQAEKAPLYRRVMGIFVEAKTRFALHLRPQDVLRALGRLEEVAPVGEVNEAIVVDGEELEKAFKQLCDWGNLEAHPDTAEVATVEEFYRTRYLYQLTPEGEAAERALAVYHDTIEQPGELQTAALADIRELLAELLQLATMDTVDAGKVHRTLLALTGRFDELTARAQSFMGSLQRTIDLQGVDLEAFLSYKDNLIEYLERFIGELVMTTSEIASTLEQLAAADPQKLLRLAARRDLADAVAPTEDYQVAALSAWQARWEGLKSWFIGGQGGSQAELLRARARAAIPALLNAVISIHDRRVRRSDRFTDLRTLARWFAETDSDHQAHRLWRTAFGLTPARHLRIDAATLDLYDAEPVSPNTSWLEAPPLCLTPRLRRTGHFRRKGRNSQVIDRSKAKEMLARLVADEAAQVAEARRRLAGGPLLLSEIGHLEQGAFTLFLDLLGDALAHRSHPSESVETGSADGSLHIILEPIPEAKIATLQTSNGLFSGPDHIVTIRDLLTDDGPLDLGMEPASLALTAEPTL
jgi:uncharacterized protein (TIGR02677 family)